MRRVKVEEPEDPPVWAKICLFALLYGLAPCTRPYFHSAFTFLYTVVYWELWLPWQIPVHLWKAAVFVAGGPGVWLEAVQPAAGGTACVAASTSSSCYAHGYGSHAASALAAVVLLTLALAVLQGVVKLVPRIPRLVEARRQRQLKEKQRLQHLSAAAVRRRRQQPGKVSGQARRQAGGSATSRSASQVPRCAPCQPQPAPTIPAAQQPPQPQHPPTIPAGPPPPQQPASIIPAGPFQPQHPAPTNPAGPFQLQHPAPTFPAAPLQPQQPAPAIVIAGVNSSADGNVAHGSPPAPATATAHCSRRGRHNKQRPSPAGLAPLIMPAPTVPTPKAQSGSAGGTVAASSVAAGDGIRSSPIGVHSNSTATASEACPGSAAWVATDLLPASAAGARESSDGSSIGACSSSTSSESLLGQSECVVCLDQRRCTVLIPCGHIVLCSSCAADLMAAATTGAEPLCPVCRQGVCMLQRVYY